MRHFKKKKLEMVSWEWFFHKYNVLVHTATIGQAWLAPNQVKEQPPHLPDLAQWTISFSREWRRRSLAFG
jgi:hypothetical protein